MAAPNQLITIPFISNDPANNPGGMYLDNGLIGSNGKGALVLGPSPTVQAPTGAAQTITTAYGLNRTAPTAACSTAILQKGTANGQIIIVTNEAQTVAFIITFDVPANSFVWDDGTNPMVLKAGSASMFVWIQALQAGGGAWVRLGPVAG